MRTLRKTRAAPRCAFTPARTGLLQRKCACGQHTGDGECEACRKNRVEASLAGATSLQRQPTNQAEPTTVPPIVYKVLRSPGQPLDAATRAFFEPRFGHDFTQVRVHADTKAAESARTVNALAYTVGQQVVFAEGQYAPRTSDGHHLLAHELAHTIQQSGDLRQPGDLPARTDPEEAVEREADTAADGMMQQQVFSPRLGRANAVARRPAPAAPPPPSATLPTATFDRFVVEGAVRCCRAVGPKGCPPHLGPARPGDPRPKNGMNLIASITGHRPGIEYGFVQVIHFRQCVRFSAALGGGWAESDSKGPGADDSPNPEATCPIPNALNQIVMTDAPGLAFTLGSPADLGFEEATHRVNAIDWVIARESPAPWRKISDFFHWHSITGIQKGAGGALELTPAHNEIGPGFTKIGGCPPP